ncbi:hypothetical protein QN277_014519 [Acacia crassicarpa]|uniref:FCP1 homology domain-containing protein n=1 Tax=Acacia crassicarpa TaxID=499986 RepID=A0AAE1IKS1_9FABA|nr:hypothetical protein QN277_014519 [Acacia crassicarpa]
MTCSVVSNGNLSAVPREAFSTEISTATLAVPLTHPDEQSLDSVMRQSQVESASKENNLLENSSDKSQILTGTDVRLKRRKKRQEKGHNATKNNDKHTAVPKNSFSTETSKVSLTVPPTHPDEHPLDSVMRQAQVENESKEKNVIENSSDKSQIMTGSESILTKKRRKKRKVKGHDVIESNDNLSAVPKDAFSTETSKAALAVPPTHPYEHSLDSVMRQSQVQNALNEKNVLENASHKSQIMKGGEVSSRNKRKKKRRQGKGHDASESNNNLSTVPKDAFSTETSAAALAVPPMPTHPDEHSLDSVMRQSQVENALNEKNVLENASHKSQIMKSGEVSSRNKRKKKRRQEKGHDASESNNNLSTVPKDAFSTVTSTAALVVPPMPTHPDEHSLDPAMRQSQVENALNEKNVLLNGSDKSQITTSVEVSSRNKRKRKKRKVKGHNASESNANLPAVPKDTLSVETSTAPRVMLPTHPFQQSVDPLMRQLAEKEGKENHVLQHVTDGYLAMTNLDVNSSKKNKKRKRKKARHNYIETNVNLFGVLKDNTSLEASTPILDLPPLHSGQSPMGPVMRLSQEANEEVQAMIGNATDGSTAVANEEISSRNENKKRKRRKTCDINHHEVPKDTFSPKTCTLTSDMPSRYPALDLVMSQYQEENQGKDPNMVEKAIDGSSAMISVEVNSSKKNKEGRRREKTKHDSLPSNVNLSGVSEGDISHLTVVSKHDHSKASHFSIGRAISSYPKKKLLVLDLNGLLADFVLGVPEGYKPDKKIHNKAVFKRPFCDDFLQFCFDKFHVGIWSSRKRQNVDAAIKLLVGVSKSKLLFAWDQRHCTKTKFQTIEDEQKPLMLKELRMLWEKSRPGLPWAKGEFNETNTLLLDDSPYKAIRNPMHTAIFPYSYRYNDTNDSSLGPGGDLRVYLEGLAMAENVPQYVASHPFGQPPITKSNPHWNFYCEVRDQGLVAKRPTKKRYRRNRQQHCYL